MSTASFTPLVILKSGEIVWFNCSYPLMKDRRQRAGKRAFEISRTNRFLYRTRYFTDSGIIGSREFVSVTYQQFKHLFQSKHEKKPKLVKGLDGVYSLKRLSEMKI